MPAAVHPNAFQPIRACAWAIIGAWAAAGAQGPVLSLRVVSDEPGRLVIEASVPPVSLARVGEEGWRAACGGCDRASIPGIPDLPYASFNILSTHALPRVSVEFQETGTQSVPDGIAPEPSYPSQTRTLYRRDEAAWAAASAGRAQVGPPGARGARVVRAVRVPLARWSESSRMLTSARKALITVEYSQAGPDCGSRISASLAVEVANPKGGACLALPVPALAKALRPAAPPRPGDSLVRITIGDADPGSFAEDKVYALPFAEVLRLAPTAVALPLGSLRLYAGPADTLRAIAVGSPYAGSLRQVPVDVRDLNSNGIFDGGDSLVFYGRGSSIWKRINAAAAPIRFAFTADPGSRSNSYWLDFSGRDPDPASRLPVAPAGPRASQVRTASRHYLRAERDQLILACDHAEGAPPVDSAAGTFWFWLWKGDCGYGEKSRTITGAQLAAPETEILKDAVQQAGDSLFVGMFAHPYRAVDDYDIRLEGGTGILPLVSDTIQGNWYVSTDALPGGRFRFASVDWLSLDTRFEGYTVCYRRRLAFSGQPLRIFPEVFGERVSYRVEGAQGASCVRIEGGVAVKRMSLDGEGVFTDSLGPDADATWLVYGAAALPEAASLSLERPGAAGAALRNLADADGGKPEYLILAPEAFAAEAAALAKYRNDPKRAIRFRTAVALAEDVYRQYSGGRPSPAAIRDFIRWGWASWGGGPAGSNPLKHVLLLGDGHYDLLGLRSGSRGEAAKNRIPVYEWLTAGPAGEGMASDDYYGLLDAGEAPADSGSYLDIAVGRVPANTAAQAADYLAKAKAWEDPEKGGAWRSRITFAADDGIQKGGNNGTDDKINEGHTTSSDSVSRLIERNQPGLAADKVYLVEYPLNSAWHKPEASQDLLSFINEGTSLVNFVGHGSYNQWADEVLLQSNDGLARMRNQGRTPMINAFSCTVGRFDDFAKVGLSELFVTAAGKGAIAAVSAVREAYPTPNIMLAEAFYSQAFPAAGAGPMPIGEALRLAKNDAGLRFYAYNSTLYSLLGEPVTLLRKPTLSIAIDQAPDTLRALECGTIRGRVEGGSGSGSINIRVVSQSQARAWPPPWPTSRVHTQHAIMRGSVLFEGTFPYSGGRFEAGYFAPRQVAFGDTNARILAYAWDGKEEKEGAASKEGIRILGVSTGACAQDADGKGPAIRVSGCEGAEAAGVDFPEQVRLPLPYCLEVTVEDSTGGVLSSEGPDDGTVFEIPGAMDPFHPRPGIDGLYRKVFRLPLEMQTVGTGQRLLKIAARDGYGNRSLRVLRMDLSLDSSVQTVSAYNVPNPAKRSGTTFWFSTVLPARSVDYDDPTGGGARLEFEVRIFDQAGRLVRRFEDAVSGATQWDGKDAWGNTMGNGVYFYQVTARQILLAGDRPGYRTLSSKRNTLILSR